MHNMSPRPNLKSVTGWDDLIYVLAVQECGSLAAAARALVVNHSTVLRRLDTLEQRLGVRLFERLASGYVPTAAGDEMAETARRMREQVDAMERRVLGQDLRLSGVVRATTAESLAQHLIVPHMPEFQARHPGITVEMVISNSMLDLSRRETDVAVRPAAEPPEDLIGRRISQIAWAVYAAPEYIARNPSPDLSEHAWLLPDGSLAEISAARWLRQRVPEARVALRSDSITTLSAAAEYGLGVVLLPCHIGDLQRGLRRIGAPVEGVRNELWMLTHEDLRRTARVKVFMDFFHDVLTRYRPLLEGNQPQLD